jgi:hypothetical protein
MAAARDKLDALPAPQETILATTQAPTTKDHGTALLPSPTRR